MRSTSLNGLPAQAGQGECPVVLEFSLIRVSTLNWHGCGCMRHGARQAWHIGFPAVFTLKHAAPPPVCSEENTAFRPWQRAGEERLETGESYGVCKNLLGVLAS